MVRVRVAMLSCLAVCGSPIAGLACLRAFEVTGIGMGYSRDGARGGIYKDGFVRCWNGLLILQLIIFSSHPSTIDRPIYPARNLALSQPTLFQPIHPPA